MNGRRGRASTHAAQHVGPETVHERARATGRVASIAPVLLRRLSPATSVSSWLGVHVIE